MRVKSWTSILAIIALVTLLGQISRQTHLGIIVLFGSAVFFTIIGRGTVDSMRES